MADALEANGATRETIEKAIEALHGGKSVNHPNAEESRQALQKYTIDLIERAGP